MKEQEYYYTVIPGNVRSCKGLNANAKLLYGEILARSTIQGSCFISNHFLTENFDVRSSTISKWLFQLQKEGFLTSKTVIEKGTYYRAIKLLFPY